MEVPWESQTMSGETFPRAKVAKRETSTTEARDVVGPLKQMRPQPDLALPVDTDRR